MIIFLLTMLIVVLALMSWQLKAIADLLISIKFNTAQQYKAFRAAITKVGKAE